MVVQKLFNNKVEISHCERNIELKEITDINRVLKWDSQIDKSQAETLTSTPHLYEIVLQSIHPVPYANNRISPLSQNHVRCVPSQKINVDKSNISNTRTASPQKVNFSKYNRCPKECFVRNNTISKENNVDLIKNSDCTMAIQTICDKRNIEFIPLNTLSLQQNDNSLKSSEDARCEIHQYVSNDTQLYNNVEGKGNEDFSDDFSEPIISTSEVNQTTSAVYDIHSSSIEDGNRLEVDCVKYTVKDESISVGVNTKQARKDKTPGNVGNLKLTVRRDNWVGNTEHNGNNNKWTNILHKVKCHLQTVKETLSSSDESNDDWTVSIPSSLSIESKESDWSTEINDIEKSCISEDIWFHNISEIYVEGHHLYSHLKGQLPEVNNNDGYQNDSTDTTLQNVISNKDLPVFRRSVLCEIHQDNKLSPKTSYFTHPDQLCAGIRGSEWTSSINDIESANQCDDVWTTMINPIHLS